MFSAESFRQTVQNRYSKIRSRKLDEDRSITLLNMTQNRGLNIPEFAHELCYNNASATYDQDDELIRR